MWIRTCPSSGLWTSCTPRSFVSGEWKRIRRSLLSLQLLLLLLLVLLVVVGEEEAGVVAVAVPVIFDICFFFCNCAL